MNNPSHAPLVSPNLDDASEKMLSEGQQPITPESRTRLIEKLHLQDKHPRSTILDEFQKHPWMGIAVALSVGTAIGCCLGLTQKRYM